MLESTNPFNDPEFKKQILSDSGVNNDNYIFEEVENIDNDDSGSGDLDFKSIISSAPVIPKSARNLVLDASALARNQKEEKAKELTYSLSQVFTQYNETYGTDLSIDFNNLSNTLVNVSDPETRKTLELYVSEVFKSIRPVLLLHLIQKLSLAIDYCTDTSRLFDSNSFSPQDIFIIVDKLISYIDQLNEICKEVVVPDSDKILKKLSEEKNDASLESEDSKKAIDEFMKLFTQEQNNKK